MRVALFSLVLLGVVLFLGIWYIRLLLKMRKPVVFPVTEEEWKAIRIRPEKPVGLPNVSNQRAGV